MDKNHLFSVIIKWTGNTGSGTSSYKAYERSHLIQGEGKQDIQGSSAPVFRGDGSMYNSEELFIASLSSCHMLWYLHLCADNGVIVTEYFDNASGTMVVRPDGGGHFVEVTLHPVVTVKDVQMISRAIELHRLAHEKCFIANSCNFPVYHQPQCIVEVQ